MFSNGWINVLGYWLSYATVNNFIASMVVAIATLWYPDLEIGSLQYWILYLILVWSTVAINTFGSRALSSLNKLISEVA